MEIKEIVEKVYESANDEGYVQIEGVVSQNTEGAIDFLLPFTNFSLHVKNDDDSLEPGQKVMILLPVEQILSWMPFALAFEAMENVSSEKEVVYVLLMENNTVKIGRTKKFVQRIKTISTSSGMKIMKHWKTESIPPKQSSRVENMAHKHFKKKRRLGEFFEIDFDEACSYVESLLTA